MSALYTLSGSATASTSRSLLFLLLLSCQRIAGVLGKSQLCEVEREQTNIILDIEGSRGACFRNASNKRRSIPIIVRVSDVNDNAPRCMNTPYEVTVPESTLVGTTIFRHIQALDKYAGVNDLVEYFIVEGNTNTTEDEAMTIADGYGTFAISFPHQEQRKL